MIDRAPGTRPICFHTSSLTVPSAVVLGWEGTTCDRLRHARPNSLSFVSIRAATIT